MMGDMPPGTGRAAGSRAEGLLHVRAVEGGRARGRTTAVDADADVGRARLLLDAAGHVQYPHRQGLGAPTVMSGAALPRGAPLAWAVTLASDGSVSTNFFLRS